MSLFDCCDMIAALQFEASPTLRRRVDCRALTPTTEPKRAMVEADHSISRHILKWETIIDPEDGMRECRAHASGIDFYIWHSIGKRPFGLTAYRQLPDGTNEQVHSGIGS